MMMINRWLAEWTRVSIAVLMLLTIGTLFPRESFAAKKQEELPQPPPAASASELSEMQTRIIRSEPKATIAALLSVLTNDGWTTETTTTEPVTVQAKSLRTQEHVGPQNDWILQYDEKTQLRLLSKPERRFLRQRAWTRWLELGATFESRENGITLLRISIVKMGVPPLLTRKRVSVAPLRDEPLGVVLDDSEQYSRIFGELERELATRRTLESAQ